MYQPHRSSLVANATYHLPKFIGTRQLSTSPLENLHDQSARCTECERDAQTYESLFEKRAMLVLVVKID